ncbi:hypothetical protein JCM10908_001766 [Rhodotorula pacifica]|uniref:uncharacterized protein n=1 Tax=Rhodotorula pacifica TaxID=1495444 RepID=UPI00316F03CB
MTRLEPVASTSRVPYSANSAITTSAPPTRAFSSSAPRSRGGGGAHLIHPMLRQRLTNLTFLSAGLLSVLTVSLTMSGTFGEGAAPGCPARVRTGVALQGTREEEERRTAAVEGGGGRRKWWETEKAKGRFLEDPVVAGPPVAAVTPATALSVAKPAFSAGYPPHSDTRAEDGAAARPEASPSNMVERIGGRSEGGDWQSGWKGLREPEERVV